MSTIEQKVKELVAENLGVDVNDVKDEVKLVDLGADSLDMVEIVMSVEEEYDIEISDDKFYEDMTVKEFAAIVIELAG